MKKFRTDGDLAPLHILYVKTGDSYTKLALRFKVDTHNKEVWVYPDKQPEKSMQITWKEYQSALKIFRIIETMYGWTT